MPVRVGMTIRYVAWASVVGSCSHRHRTVRGAARCAMRYNRSVTRELLTKADFLRWQRRVRRDTSGALSDLNRGESTQEEQAFFDTPFMRRLYMAAHGR